MFVPNHALYFFPTSYVVIFFLAQPVDARGDVDIGEIIYHLCLNNEKDLSVSQQ